MSYLIQKKRTKQFLHKANTTDNGVYYVWQKERTGAFAAVNREAGKNLLRSVDPATKVSEVSFIDAGTE